MAAIQAREFEAVKHLLSPSRDLEPFTSYQRPQNSRTTKQITRAQKEYWILIGTILVASSSSAINYSSRVRFYSALWTWLSLGFEILLERSVGRPLCTFRTFRVITRSDAIWKACVIGDLEKMDRLFARGLASPYDSTDDGATLLHVGIYDYFEY